MSKAVNSYTVRKANKRSSPRNPNVPRERSRRAKVRMPHRSVVLPLPPLLLLVLLVVAAAPLLLVVLVLVFAAEEELAVLAAAAVVVGLPPRPSFSLSAAFPCTNHADADVCRSKEEERGEVSKHV